MAKILEGGEHLLHLIEDVLDLSKIETGSLAVSIESHPVAGLLAEVVTTLEPTAEREGIHLQLEPVPPDVPAIDADRTRFVQVLLNFGSNAIKYNRPSGSVTFAVSLPGNDRVRVSIRDTGIGISADKQQKLFQPFQRAGQEMGPIEGTGIGLVITRRLACLMHGEVGFESTPGEGSVFWVDMPARR